jgi:hypothetical protein
VLVHDSVETVIGDAKGQKSYYCMLAYQFWDEGHDGALAVAPAVLLKPLVLTPDRPASEPPLSQSTPPEVREGEALETSIEAIESSVSGIPLPQLWASNSCLLLRGRPLWPRAIFLERRYPIAQGSLHIRYAGRGLMPFAGHAS